MAQPLIIIIGAEITFLDDNKTKEYDIIKLHDSGNWVYTKTGNIERWFPVVRIHEIRRDTRAKERMESGANQYSLPENFPEGSEGDTRDNVAERVGIRRKNNDIS